MVDTHGWSAQVFGAGYTEERQRYFDSNNRLVGASITVRWNNSATISQMNYDFPGDGSVTTSGQLKYPDDTHANAHFLPDGRFSVAHTYGDGSSTSWGYAADGSCLVFTTMGLDMGSNFEGSAQTWWSLNPDGSPVGDYGDSVSWTNTATGEQMVSHTTKSPDGTTTVVVKKWDANGTLIENSTTTSYPHPPEARPSTETAPTRPTARVGGPRPTVDAVVTTTRTPDPGLSPTVGWTFGGGGVVEHWLDWWLETPDGRTILLGSTLKTKKDVDD